MRLGFILLAHKEFDRSSQLINHLCSHGFPVVVHVDARADRKELQTFKDTFSSNRLVKFVRARPCNWGTWSLVDATQDAVRVLLEAFPDVEHVFLGSGACLPLRPLAELDAFLARQPDTDFIESVTIEDVDWTVGGLDSERFTLWFPFLWKTQRWLFDKSVKLQRRWGVSRKFPEGLEPHLGSQWWCLTRATLTAIFNDPDRKTYEKYFRSTWIPDESYFQTMARRHSKKISSRSLTLSKFDQQGKPHVFYDDHLPLLRRSDCFFARKIWPKANRLYDSFLSDHELPTNTAEPAPGMIDRVFATAAQRRRFGRDGLYMAGREPIHYERATITAAPYWVFEGFETVFPGFSEWFADLSGARVHGHLFSWDGANFAGKDETFAGGLTSTPALRDYRPHSFLTNLIWNTRGERQAFHFGPDDRQEITETLVFDPNARLFVITGAWALDLLNRARAGEDIRKAAARMQRTENWHIGRMRDRWSRARFRIWSLADAVLEPGEVIGAVIDSAAAGVPVESNDFPKVASLNGLSEFLQGLRDQGMNPYLAGDFTADLEASAGTQVHRSYLVD